MRVHTMLVTRLRYASARQASAGATWKPGAVSLRVHGKGNIGAKPKSEVIAEILQRIKERQA